MPPLGESFGRYTLLEPLGAGGMGAVYRARDERLGRLVALKVVRTADGAAPAPEATARLLREARAAAALTHPNVVAIYDVAEHDGVPCIAMELVLGAPLRRWIGADAPLRERLGWLRQVADALAAAHALGIIHRDIKPDNVVIRQGGLAKVLDFGLAREAAAGPTAAADGVSPNLATITQDGGVIGTPAYMAPEQIRGEPLDARCDQFAWGVMAFEVLSGSLPWREGLTTLGLLAAVLTDPIPRLSAPGVPELVADVVARATSKAAADRFPSMQALLAALDRAMGDLPPRASSAPDGDGAGPIDAADTLLAPGPPGDLSAAASGPPPGPRALPAAVDAKTAARLEGPTSPIAAPPAGATEVAPRPGRRRWALGAVAAVTVLGLGVLVSRQKEEAPPPAPTESPSAEVPDPEVPIRTLANEPAPTTTDDAESIALYRTARERQRECDWDRARELLEQAVARAPTFGEAQLQVAAARWSALGFGVDATVREAYRRAVDERRRMSARDRALLEAHEPLFARDPPDWGATIAAMTRLAEKRPGDAEIRLRVAQLRGITGDYDTAAHVAAAVELDPDYADAWQMKMYVEAAANRADEAVQAAEECHRIAPNSRECALTATAVHSFFGRCEAAEREARRTQGNELGQVHGTLLLGLGRPRRLVEEAFERGWARRGALQPPWEALDRWSIAMADADFGAAKGFAKQLLELTRRGLPHGEAFRWGALVALATTAHEDGTMKAESAVLRAELLRAHEWEGDAPFYLNGALTAWGLLRRHGLGKEEEVSRALQAYRARYADVFSKHPTLDWVAGCELVDTPERARAHVAVRPADLRPGALFNSPQGRAHVGTTLLLAGDVAGAIPWLQQAADSCRGWSRAYPYVEVHVTLGEAREAAGEPEKACEAYAFVIQHWGGAKPRSATADRARARARALSCPAPAGR